MTVILIATLVWLSSLTATAWILIKRTEKLDSQIDNLETCIAKLSEVVAEIKEPELTIERQIEESKKQVMEELIKNITEYSPYGV